MCPIARPLQAAFAGKRVLITGGLGFIGSNLARHLVSLDAEVLLVDSLIPEYGGNVFNIQEFRDRVRLNISDVRDQYSLQYLVKGQDYLFNLAGQTSHMDSMVDPFTDLEINCRAQLSILETCRRHQPDINIVFASTRQIYGKPDYLPVDEKHLTRPVDVNGVNKMAGEWFHILYHNVYGMRTCAIRLGNTYGPRMRVKDARQTFLGIWIRFILEGKPFEVWDGQQLRDFCYVDDAVESFLLAAASPSAGGCIFNLGGSEPISLNEMAAMLVDINGSGNYIVRSFPSDRKRIDIGNYYANDSNIRESLGWAPRASLRQGVTTTLQYYRQHLTEYL